MKKLTPAQTRVVDRMRAEFGYIEILDDGKIWLKPDAEELQFSLVDKLHKAGAITTVGYTALVNAPKNVRGCLILAPEYK